MARKPKEKKKNNTNKCKRGVSFGRKGRTKKSNDEG